MAYFSKLYQAVLGAPAAAIQTSKQQWQTVVATFVAIVIVSSVSVILLPTAMTENHLLLVASMGASVMLLIAIPNSPLTQPYPLVIGHVVPATIGVLSAMIPVSMPFQAAICVSGCLMAMFLLKCLHPPGGAASLVPVIMGNEAIGGFDFVIFPVLMNVSILLLVGWLIHRYWLKKEYPVQAVERFDKIHQHHDASPLIRLGIDIDDMKNALVDFNAYLNITTKDLVQLYGFAQQRAYSRKFKEIRCEDIMSRDVATVSPDTELEEAWALLRKHKVKILPVVDNQRHIVGIISLVDFLKRADLKVYEGFAERIENFIKPQRNIASDKPQWVKQIMATAIFSVKSQQLIATLVPILSDLGYHHVPIVDDDNKLCGIITQSDLIAALYSSSLSASDSN